MGKELEVRGSRQFLLLAISTAVLTVGLIVFGAVVRVTDSGLGCGNDWPLCNGTIFPPLDNLTAWIEWLHRLFALLIGISGLFTLAIAWRVYRRRDRSVLIFTSVAALLFVVQSGLGAIVVIFELPPTFVTLHLGTAMLLLGALLAAAVHSWYQPVVNYSRDHITGMVYINAIFALVIVLTGALVRGSGATLACADWPLCFGEAMPIGYGQLAIIHMAHRYAVLAFGVALWLLVWQIHRRRHESLVRKIAAAAFVIYLLQAGVGAMFVISVAGPQWGALHVGMAAAVWGLLVILSVIESLNTREFSGEQAQKEWIPQS